MQNKISELVSGADVAAWLVIALLVGYFIYKEWPELKKRISGNVLSAEKAAATDKSLSDRLDRLESVVNEINAKLSRDYGRLNDIESWRDSMQRIAADSLEERELLMRAMLGVLGGLQEIGANGPTKEAESKIRDYLNRKAHTSSHVERRKEERNES